MSFRLVFLFIPIAVLPICLSRLEEDASLNSTTDNNATDNCNLNNKCFHAPPELCPRADSPCRCHQLPNCSKAVVCCNVTSFQLVEGLACANVSDGNVTAVHVRNATLDTLNLSQPTWRRLKYMTITDGHIKSVTGEFTRLTSISYLNLSSNGISKFDDRSLGNLFDLRYLDVSHNNLTEVPRFKMEGAVTLDISYNPYILCSSVLDALKRAELFFSNGKQTYCSSSKTFHWFNTTEHLPLIQIIGLHELSKDCQKMNSNCLCVPSRVDLIPGKAPIFAIDVNCSNRKLKQMPTPLPPNTVSLNIANNNITSLAAVNNDISYVHLRELYADNNQITSVLPLEGSKFISNFVVLSLRNNKIDSLPTYMFSNAFDRNFFLRTVYLEKNHIHCDCNTAKNLKVWLLTKAKQIPDYKEIFCENINSPVMDLNPSTLCQSTSDWTDYVYYIITFQVLLLVGLIAKVFYDYWVFKTAGYLPWPASKMPKMPCDWLCE
ncbi:protein halfway [Coccinella septempunctata]|uniref:protein halfway n=1 Tax=Coccinella septempunctata TaxID=41139 RepID=UPI001D066BB1|nr:protein halfway [Coccinella septempunctata]XP_044766432.1 protein halfway [Coccinella septempunctata]XP_044766433.1 protein halfway [Coccinella septempunctata]